MAEAFVRTIKRDNVRVSPCPDADTVMHQLSAWITQYNEVHPHIVHPVSSSQLTETRDHVRSFGGYNNASHWVAMSWGVCRCYSDDQAL
jgi:hypothetical protein